jgi:D-amino peptidase
VAFAVSLLVVSVGHAQKTGPKVLLAFDMEGVTGAEQAGDYNYTNPNYKKTQQSLTDDVNAAIRGLLKGGAAEVVLTDCHASDNNVSTDYLLDQLPKGARFDMRDQPFDPYVDGPDKTYGALAMVGMHVRSGSDGFAPHTYYGTIRWNMNGLEMSETSMVALSAARFGVPLVLVTGDDRHKSEVTEFSKAEYVIVKKAITNQKAEARPRDEVSADIEAAAERGLMNIRQNPPYKFTTKISSTAKFPMSDYTAMMSNYPGVTVVNDKTLGFTTATYLDSLKIYLGLSNLLRYATADTLLKAINQIPGGAEIVRSARAKMPPRNYDPSLTPFKVDNKLNRWGYE